MLRQQKGTTMKNFTYNVNSTKIEIEIEGYFDVDLSNEWIIWGDYDGEYNDLQHSTIKQYIEQHFGHLWTDKANTLNSLQGFAVTDFDYDFNHNKLEVDLYVEMINDKEDEYLEDHNDVVERIVNSINIEGESWYEVQEEQFDWFLENGVSGEDHMLARKMIDHGYVFDYALNGEYNHACMPIDSVDQSVVDRFVQEQIDMWNLDQGEIKELQEAVEDADFVFNYQPKLQAA